MIMNGLCIRTVMRKYIVCLPMRLVVLWLGIAGPVSARPPMRIHSHNDYRQRVPFYQAYAQQVASIEADVYLYEGKLLVGHDVEDLRPEMSFEALYVEPLVTLFARNGGQAFRDSDCLLQLMIELKSASDPTLRAVAALLVRWPEVFDPAVNPRAVRVTVTGRVPTPERFDDYPSFICFDGNWKSVYTQEQLKRVALVSCNFRDFSQWNGKGSIVPVEERRLREAIDRAHEWGKPIRFWNAPEGITVYYTFYNLGIDYVNTDKPEACAAFFRDFGNKNFRIGDPGEGRTGVTGTHRLDQVTRDFTGYRNDRLQLPEPVGVYRPTYRNDGGKGRIRNVILLIGDGMGLSQIMAAACVNRDLTLFSLVHLGLQRNNAAGDFTTDSAAAGSAMATGERHPNRWISMTADGQPIPSLCDWFREKGWSVGIVTLGNVADATPAAFYGHADERDRSDDLTRCLRDVPVDLLCGSGIRQFVERGDGIDLLRELSDRYCFIRSVDELPNGCGRVICLDERMGRPTEAANLSLLAETTRMSIDRLRAESDKGLFLVVEGAKIDFAGHSHCLPGTVLEMLSFDKAVAEALRFADSNGETLVIVTGDHETGGLVLLDGDERSGRILGVYTSEDHTPAMLPVFAYGPKAARFCGVYLNTEIARRIRAVTE